MKTQTQKMKQEFANKNYLFTRRRNRSERAATLASDSIERVNNVVEISKNSSQVSGRGFRTGISAISADDRKAYAVKFLKLADSSGTISSSQLSTLLGPDELDLGVDGEEVQACIHQMLTKTSFAGKCDIEHLNLEFFLSLVSRINQKTQPASGPRQLRPNIPFDPDSTWKQIWDLFCLLLLFYCSFSVPYGIAFLADSDGSLGALEISNLVVDMVFMVDILLSFLTAVEIDGIITRDLGNISGLYLRSWFVPDFAGSFPFDTVITVILENQRNLNSNNFLRFLKFIRMLKLIRAIKFMNKMNKLKQQEGYEARPAPTYSHVPSHAPSTSPITSPATSAATSPSMSPATSIVTVQGSGPSNWRVVRLSRPSTRATQVAPVAARVGRGR